jgi:hypothetical protein
VQAQANNWRHLHARHDKEGGGRDEHSPQIFIICLIFLSRFLLDLWTVQAQANHWGHLHARHDEGGGGRDMNILLKYF